MIFINTMQGDTINIRVVRNVVDTYIKNGSTANLCALDLSKAFDKVNHYALYLNLMTKLTPLIPREILNLIKFWLTTCYLRVKRCNVWSDFLC